MSCSMVTGWANTAEIASITVTPSGENPTVRTYESTATDIKVNPSDLVSVKVKIKDTTPAALAAAEATFLSALTTAFADGATLSNDNIQYVDQQTTAVVDGDTDTDAYATFTFRPRLNSDGDLLLSGGHTAKVGGTEVDNPTTFTYNVEEAVLNMTISGATQAYSQGSTSDTAFTLNLASDVTPSKVMLGSAVLTSEQYSYSYNSDTSVGTLTILATYLNTLAVTENTSYNLVVSASGYNDGTLASAITINAIAEEDVENEHTEDVVEELKDVEIPTEVTVDADNNKASIALSARTTQTGSYEVKYAINKQTDGVSIENNAIVLDTSVKPFAKVEVKVYAGTGETAYDVKTVYIVPEPENVGFGNIGLHTADTEDPFVYSEDVTQDQFMAKVNALDPTAKASDLATALNIVLYDRQEDMDALPHFESALNYVKDDKLTLAEYRIYKLMMEGDSVHTFKAVNTSRANYNTTAAED